MARPSKLTPDQWEEVGRRVATEGVRALAKEFGINAAAISRRFSQQTQAQIRNVAQQIVQTQNALSALPPAQQVSAISLADKLRNISTSLASAAELGAATSHRLQQLAHDEVAKVNGKDAAADGTALRGAAGLVQLANQAATIPLNLLASNKERVRELEGFADKVDAPAPIRERLNLADWKKAHGVG